MRERVLPLRKRAPSSSGTTRRGTPRNVNMPCAASRLAQCADLTLAASRLRAQEEFVDESTATLGNVVGSRRAGQLLENSAKKRLTTHLIHRLDVGSFTIVCQEEFVDVLTVTLANVVESRRAGQLLENSVKKRLTPRSIQGLNVGQLDDCVPRRICGWVDGHVKKCRRISKRFWKRDCWKIPWQGDSYLI